jgi:formylmethanofuran dehydrogenase subunit C
MALVLEYRRPTPVPVELDGITPDRLASHTVAEIERMPVHCGNRSVPLVELFSITGDLSDGRIDLEGDLSRVHMIGSEMKRGVIHVHGDAGFRVGNGMSGGEIHVHGNAGDWAGCEMSGGLINIKGTAGNGVGSAYPGSRQGMTDGTILIGGDAGDEVGSKMRRGMIAVRGSCGASAGFGMIAGSILVFGSCGTRPGAGMRRGTIGMFGVDSPELLPTFAHTGRFRPVFMRLIFGELIRLGFGIDRALLDQALELYRGDRVVYGKGEIWMNLR